MKMTITRTKTKEEGTQEEKNVRQKRRKESPEPARLLAGPEVTLTQGLDSGLPLVVPLLAKLERSRRLTLERSSGGSTPRSSRCLAFCGLDLGVGLESIIAINGSESALE